MFHGFISQRWIWQDLRFCRSTFPPVNIAWVSTWCQRNSSEEATLLFTRNYLLIKYISLWPKEKKWIWQRSSYRVQVAWASRDRQHESPKLQIALVVVTSVVLTLQCYITVWFIPCCLPPTPLFGLRSLYWSQTTEGFCSSFQAVLRKALMKQDITALLGRRAPWDPSY